MARLKVFTTTQGFHETAVAAPSQAKALEAWGTRQNLFAEGLARVTTEAAVVAAAMAHPGEVVRRPAQSASDIEAALAQGALEAKARKADAVAGPETAPKAAPKARKAQASGWSRVEAPKPKPPRDRSRLDAAEAALAAFDDRRAAAAAMADKERQALEVKIAQAAATLDREGGKLEAAVAKARAAYERD